MPPTRVALVGLSRLEHDIVVAILRQEPGIVIEADVPRADVLVTGAGLGDPEGLIFRAAPRGVVALSDGGRRADLLEVLVRATRLEELTTASLVAAVLSVARGGAI